MRQIRVLAIASGGGHWIQLLRLAPALDAYDTAYVSMFDSYGSVVPDARYYTVPDASRKNIWMFPVILWRAMTILMRERPDVILSTGSAPMLMFMILGRLTGIKTLWIDSIANSQRLSTSGRISRKIVHQTLSQWPDVGAAEGVGYWGAVI